jgi:hypothetical protein
MYITVFKGRSVAILSPRNHGFDLRPVHVRLVVDKVLQGQVSHPEYFGFPPSHRCSIAAFISVLLLSGQADKAWEPSKQCTSGYPQAPDTKLRSHCMLPTTARPPRLDGSSKNISKAHQQRTCLPKCTASRHTHATQTCLQFHWTPTLQA